MQPSRLNTEFISPHSLDDCIARIAAKNEQQHLIGVYRLYVNVERVDVDTCRFHIQEIHRLASKPRSYQKQEYYSLVGMLKRLPDGRTAIYARVVLEEIPLYITITGFAVMLAVALYLISFPYNLVLGLVVIGFLPILYVIFQRTRFNDMEKKIALLRDTLA